MGTEILPYRLKSARRKRRLVKTYRDKQLLQLDRERIRISKDPDYCTTIPLEEPYQKGWKRLFVLKPEVQQSDKAAFYQQILDKINTVQYHYDASFKKPKRKGRWHKYYFEELPKLQTVKQWYWRKGERKLTEEQRACFHLVQYWDQVGYRWDHYHEFSYPELFEVAVLPHVIATIKVGDALLAQRMAWIDDYLDHNGGRDRLMKLKGLSYRYWRDTLFEKQKYVNPIKNIPLYKVMDEDF